MALKDSIAEDVQNRVMEKIAVIGWGSLLWDLDDLAPHVTGDWTVAAGPRLPFEFVRVSPKRKQALVVVIDEAHGVECATSHIQSARGQLSDAVEDLARRERTVADQIGYADRAGRAQQSRHGFVVENVRSWLDTSGYDAAVWTDLGGNYHETLGEPFSIEGAIRYLKTLTGESLIEARRYIESAPENVETPLRSALRHEAWWQAVAY